MPSSVRQLAGRPGRGIIFANVLNSELILIQVNESVFVRTAPGLTVAVPSATRPSAAGRRWAGEPAAAAAAMRGPPWRRRERLTQTPAEAPTVTSAAAGQAGVGPA